MESSPLVSICSITYNHAPYIRQCLDGFMMQQTDFQFEIIINDDCSTDGTTEIIREYAERYPNIIKPVYHDENQYSKGVHGMFAKFCYPRARGKYIALCEGDDYWTDPLKLQKQVDFLESHPDYVMCTHNWNIYVQNSNQYTCSNKSESRSYNLNDLICGDWLYQTLTVLYRRSSLDTNRYNKYKVTRDYVLFYELLRNGKGYYLEGNMAVYRVHNSGVWSGVDFWGKWMSDYKVCEAIYDVEKDQDSARLFINLLSNYRISRIWLLKNFGKVFKIIIVACRHFGFVTACDLFCLVFFSHEKRLYIDNKLNCK